MSEPVLDERYIPRQEQHLCGQIREGNKENGFQFHIHEFLVISNCHAAPHKPFVRVLPEPSGVSVSHYPTFYSTEVNPLAKSAYQTFGIRF